MTTGEILVKFGAEMSGFRAGISIAMSLLENFKNAAGNIAFGLRNLGTAGTVGTDALKQGLTGMGGVALGVGAIITGVVAVIAVAIGVKAVQAAGDFQQGLNRLVTGAGDVTDNMGRMGQSILGISTSTGVLTGQLLPAMYQIISAGQRGAQAQDTLRVAAMGSVTEQAKVVDVAKALTTAMTDYGTSQFNATQFMNGYTRATQLGKVTLEQLSNSMGPILPLAKNMGISFADVAGAMATMTNAGIPAERSATSLRFLMQSLENPTKKAKDAMDAMGLSSVSVGNEMKVSLPGALDMVYRAALRAGPEGSVPFNRALSDMVGGQRSLQAMLSLTGTHLATFSADSRAVATAMNGSKTAILGWDVAQSNFNVKMGQAKAAIDALFISIGIQLLPVVTRLIGQIAPLITQFTNWVIHTDAIGNAIRAVKPFLDTMFSVIAAALPTVIGIFMQFMAVLQAVTKQVAAHKEVLEALLLIAKVLGAIIVGVLAAGLLMLAVSFAACAVVILLVIGVVMGLIEVWRLLVVAANWVAGAWNSAIAWLSGAWHTLVNTAVSVFNAIRNAIVTAFNATIAWLVGAWNSAIAFIVGIWNTLRGAATSVFNAVRSAIMTAVNAVVTWLVNAWNTCVQAVVGAFTWLYNHNYYWQALVDTIRNVVQAVVSWLVTAWQNCVAFIVGIWNTIRGVAASVWGSVSSTITSIVNAVVSWLQGAWASALAWLGGAWNTMRGLAQSAWDGVRSVFAAAWGWISGILSSLWASISGWFSGTVVPGMRTQATSAWQGVSSVFSSAWGTYIAGPLSSLAGSITGFFSNLAGQMVQFGRNLIQGIVDGINSMLGAVAGAAGNVANTITSILGFHSPPPEGPARDSDTWMPNMVTMMTSGVVGAVPQMKAAVSLLMQPVQATGGASPVVVATAAQTRAQTTRPGGDTRPVIIQFSEREIVRALMPAVADEIRIHFGGR